MRDDVADGYGRFLGSRYRKHRNILWVDGGDANPIERSEAVARLARGLKASAPHHLVTAHNRPEYSSAAFFGETDWLDVNMAYSYNETYIHVLGEWNRIGKRRPIVLGESGYEEESNDQRGGAPWRMRRQAYSALLSGALGGHAFRQRHIWRMDAEWRAALDSPGSKHMGHLQKIFTSIPWYQLVPDQAHRLVVSGFGVFGDLDYVTAAHAQDGSVAIVYFPKLRPVTIDLRPLSVGVVARWIDPTSGQSTAVEADRLVRGAREFVPPGRNAAGDEDWVLVCAGKPRGRLTAAAAGRPWMNETKSKRKKDKSHDSAAASSSGQTKRR